MYYIPGGINWKSQERFKEKDFTGKAVTQTQVNKNKGACWIKLKQKSVQKRLAVFIAIFKLSKKKNR